MSGPPVQEIDDAELAELIRHNSWNGTSPDLATDREGDPPLVFNRFRWDAMDENGRPTAACLGPGPSMFYGFCPWIEQRHEHVLESDAIECQTA